MKSLLFLYCVFIGAAAVASDSPDLLIAGPDRFTGEALVTMSTPSHGFIHYTMDGSPPTADSPIYPGAFTIRNTVTIKAFATDQSGNPLAATVFKTLTRLVPKPLPPGQWVKATEVIAMNGPRFDAAKENIGWCENGGSLLFGLFQFTPGAIGTMEADVAVDPRMAGGKMHVRLDAPDGPAIGTFVFQSTGGFDSFATQRIPVKALSGEHMLYFVFEGGIGICNFKQFRFANP